MVSAPLAVLVFTAFFLGPDRHGGYWVLMFLLLGVTVAPAWYVLAEVFEASSEASRYLNMLRGTQDYMKDRLNVEEGTQ